MDAKQGFRKLREQQSKRRIDHPLAKYNNLGQVTCVVCNLPLKNDLLWQPHLLSKKHKEAVTALKVKSSQMKESYAPPPKKIKKDVVNHSASYKEPKNEEIPKAPTAEFKGSKHSVKSALPADFFDKDTSKEMTSKKEIEEHPEKPDNDESSPVPTTSKSISEKLPEGFFDDAKIDAKVRKVEYVDKKEEEWEQFQKMIAEETKVSENLQAEEEEDLKVERDLDEYATLKKYVSRVELLKQKREEKKNVVSTKSNQKEKNEENYSEDSDDALDDILNWRAKKA
ncbi:zinc finger protein 830-like [Rhopilema esculentum]|uniref:zinc finger protein 830-like n=1 Tax=Rhopilema esculentum TaxID=499914 RepID=UPI0031DFAFEA